MMCRRVIQLHAEGLEVQAAGIKRALVELSDLRSFTRRAHKMARIAVAQESWRKVNDKNWFDYFGSTIDAFSDLIHFPKERKLSLPGPTPNVWKGVVEAEEDSRVANVVRRYIWEDQKMRGWPDWPMDDEIPLEERVLVMTIKELHTNQDMQRKIKKNPEKYLDFSGLK